MRSFLILIAVLITAPSIGHAQRVFRASSIDVAQDAKDAEHDERLDNAEHRDDAQNARIDRIEGNLEKVVELLSARPAAEKPVAAAKAETPAVVSDPSPVSALPYAYIVKHGAEWCAPCKEWDAGPRGAIEAIGWTIVPGEPDGRSIPWFEIVIGDARYEHNGKLSFNELNQIVYRHTGQRPAVITYTPPPQPSNVRYDVPSLKASIHAYRPGGWKGAVYRGVNERQMSVYTHLTRDHGFSPEQVNGLTHDEAMILHDNAHGPANERIRPARSVVGAQFMAVSSVAMPSVPAPANVGCASGGCANQLSPAFSGGKFRLFPRLFR